MPAHDEGVLQLAAVYEREGDPVSLFITQVEPVVADGLDTPPLYWWLVGGGGGGEWRGRV